MKEYNITHTDTFVSVNKNLIIRWVAQNIGFGELCLHFDKNSGKICIDSERMGHDFVKAVLSKMVDNSVFIDFENLHKQTKKLNLKELNSLFPYEPNILLLPFHVETSDTETQYRWHINKTNVVNVWLSGTEENIFQLSQNIQKEKTFPSNFKRAELWTWTVESKNP